MKIEKIQVTAQPRKLQGKWTIDYDSPVYEIGETLEEEIAKTLAEEIDWEVQSTMLIGAGWKKVKIDPDELFLWKYDAPAWLAKNCQGKFVNRTATFLFEDEKDAVLFILKYGDSY